MKRIIIFIAFMAFTLVSCNDDIERHEPTPPINQTDSTTTPTPTPASSEIKVGICWSGMSSTGVTYYTKCLGDCGAKMVRFGRYCWTEEEAKTFVSQVDAIISPGSTIGDAKTANGDPHNRSVSDDNIIKAAIAAGKPVLGICYGHQRLNQCLGGNMSQVSVLAPTSTVLHKYTVNGENVGVNSEIHNITIDPNSILYSLLGSTTIMVNSSHEYALNKISSKVWVTARADDGIVEAIEGKDGLRVMGVQFHPETLYGKLGLFKFLKIFDWFVDQAKQARTERENSSSGGGE